MHVSRARDSTDVRNRSLRHSDGFLPGGACALKALITSMYCTCGVEQEAVVNTEYRLLNVQARASDDIQSAGYLVCY